VELAQKHAVVYAAVGIHPHEAQRFWADADDVRALLPERKVIAIGEIGLDFGRGRELEAEQREAFRVQVAWAAESDMPVSVHNRAADGEILDELADFGVRTVLHCFSAGPDMASAALERGYLLSFAGNLTFKKSDSLRSLVAHLPIDSILLESDSPVLAPHSRRGRRNEPSGVVEIGHTIGECLGVPFETVCATVTATADGMFRWRAS
jgi:TatD DNase family protein